MSISARRTELPAWPLAVLLVGYPVWWVLGFSWLAVLGSAAIMLALLCVRGNVELPRGIGLWSVFLVFSVAAVIELDNPLRAVGLGVRVGNYLGSTVVLLYVYNARRTLPVQRVFGYLTCYFATIVVGGWLGVLSPHGSLSTVAERILPTAIRNNSLVAALVHPSFAEVQQPYGAPVAFVRPSAPFPYTNSWGCNVAIVVPLLIAAIIIARTAWRRVVILALMALAVVPAAATLNRGMFIAIGFSLAWAAVLYALRGRSAPFVAVLVLGAIGYLVAAATGVLASLGERLQYSGTNTGRLQIYSEAWHGALDSPLFGNGAPRPSTTVDISVGTQGQLWNVMYSYGFVALAGFVGFFAYVAFLALRVRGPAAPWPHIMLAVVTLTFFFYGYDGPQLSVAMVGAAVALRAVATGSLVPVTPAKPDAAPATQEVSVRRPVAAE
jgi:hypothetical protein